MAYNITIKEIKQAIELCEEAIQSERVRSMFFAGCSKKFLKKRRETLKRTERRIMTEVELLRERIDALYEKMDEYNVLGEYEACADILKKIEKIEEKIQDILEE